MLARNSIVNASVDTAVASAIANTAGEAARARTGRGRDEALGRLARFRRSLQQQPQAPSMEPGISSAPLSPVRGFRRHTEPMPKEETAPTMGCPTARQALFSVTVPCNASVLVLLSTSS
jgi:hypothetical protein